MKEHKLAQINIGRLVAPIDDPAIAEFVAQLDTINHLADSSPGFVWRLMSESGNATDVPYSDDPLVIVNMSVWESLESLQDFVYRSQHIHVLRDRKKWFQPMDAPYHCLWWVPTEHRPAVAEGRDRLQHYRIHGPTQHAFSFAQTYPPPVEVLSGL